MLSAMERPITISRSVEISLRVYGIWPGAAYKNLSRFIWTATILLFQTLQYRYIIAYYKTGGLSQVVNNMVTILPFSSAWFKLTAFCVNESLFRDVLAIMSRGCQIYATIDSKNLIPRTTRLCDRISRMVLLFYPLSSTVYAISALFSEEEFVGPNNQTRKGFLLIKLPFDANGSHFYDILLAVEFLYEVIFSLAIGMITSLLLTLVLHVGCQIDILCHQLRDICRDNTKQLGYLIGMHQEIICLTENIAKLFTHIALFQFMYSTLAICCVGFLIVISLGMENAFNMLYKSTVFYIYVTTESFVFCIAGEYLSTKCRTVGHAAYESLWYDLCPAECRLVLLLILRSQKEVTITIGKFTNLSLNTFATILKSSASYISVLLAVY